MKVSELIRDELDLYVWRIECRDYKRFKQSKPFDYSPSTNPAQGHPLIEKYRIRLDVFSVDVKQPDDELIWEAIIDFEDGCFAEKGETPLIAVMRCIVASKFGETVDESQA